MTVMTIVCNLSKVNFIELGASRLCESSTLLAQKFL